jgi:hypothetical protein
LKYKFWCCGYGQVDQLFTGGYFCATPGNAAPDGVCTAGHYCTVGVDTATPLTSGSHTGTGGQCSAGNYCPTNSATETPCPAGTYAINTGMYLSCSGLK